MVVGLAVLLTVAAPVCQASATSQFSNFRLDAFGVDAGGAPEVKVYIPGLFQVASFLAFDPAFRGGVRVAVGDIDGDGIDDVVAGAGPGGGPHVQVFRGVECSPGPTCPLGLTVDPNPAASFFAFDPAFTGGVYVAVGNFDPSNDPSDDPSAGPPPCKRHEIVVAAGEGGGPHVKIFRNQTTGGADCPAGTPLVLDAASPIASFMAFDPAFTGGVRVAAGDLNDDSLADLVVGAGPGGGPHVMAFQNLSAGAVFGGLDVATPVASFFAFDPAFAGGVYVGLHGPLDRRDLVVGAGAGGGPHVVVIQNTGAGTAFGFNLTAPLASFFAFDSDFTGGVRVGSPVGLPFLHLTTGPGGGGFVKTMAIMSPLVPPLDIAFGSAPFDLSPLGVFPSQ
jgi:hypothetical protein